MWSNEKGQDDLKWYEAKKDGDEWYVDIDICDHKYDAGIYNAACISHRQSWDLLLWW